MCALMFKLRRNKGHFGTTYTECQDFLIKCQSMEISPSREVRDHLTRKSNIYRMNKFFRCYTSHPESFQEFDLFALELSKDIPQ